jgi:hypothetical protein
VDTRASGPKARPEGRVRAHGWRPTRRPFLLESAHGGRAAPGDGAHVRQTRTIRNSRRASVPNETIRGAIADDQVGAARPAAEATGTVDSMKTIALSMLFLLTAGCAAWSARTAGDKALCGSEPTDQVERQAFREWCR